ncbi:MAG TPA: DUF6443 domain-containing protein, partial [Ignavibacteriaceae bacterium]
MNPQKFTFFIVSVFYANLLIGQSSDMNYITQTDLLKAETNPANVPTLGDGNRIKTIQYFDGLGRGIQTNGYHNSPTLKDLVQITQYDDYGREDTAYLPFTADANGSYRSTGQDLALAFYASPPDNTIPTDSYPYGVKAFDNSPQNKVMKQGYPGLAWQLNNHPQQFHFLTNTSTLKVPLFIYDEGTQQFSTTCNYSGSTLLVSETLDEDGHQTFIYKDNYNRVVSQEKISAGNKFKTFYIYDKYGNLAVVVQPEGTKLINGSFTSTSDFIAKWCFTYKYDHRHRMVEKKIPGMNNPVLMIYDSLDRLILTQDGNLKLSSLHRNEWYYTKYDALGRPVLEGLYTNRQVSSRVQMQELCDEYFWDHGYFESRTNDNFKLQYGYTNNAFPPIDSCKILKVYYYDNYDFDVDGTPDYVYQPCSGYTQSKYW